jgi:putative phosphoesterase
MRTRLRVAILSDTHGYLDERIAEALVACNYTVHAGDIGGAGVLALLNSQKNKTVLVRGNNDIPQKWSGQQALLNNLPLEAELPLPGGRLMVVHGHRAGPVATRHLTLRKKYPQARAVVYGHSHRMVCDQVQLPWILNPGAAGKSRTYGGPSCMILHIDGEQWRVETLRFNKL